MTVRDLRRLLENVPDETPVAMAVPPGIVSDRLTTYLNLRVEYSGGQAFIFRPHLGDLSQPHPRRR
jgi:hypothetical protein